jgi:hypothetical protein
VAARRQSEILEGRRQLGLQPMCGLRQEPAQVALERLRPLGHRGSRIEVLTHLPDATKNFPQQMFSYEKVS